jgi:CubicO group peptidase (beta-lactamase class C family)
VTPTARRDARRAVRAGIASVVRRGFRLAPIVVLAACSGPVARPGFEATSALEVPERIRRVEQGLLPANVIAGQPLPVMMLEERMRVFNVPGVSIAVVNGGRIEWAKGYGVARAGDPRLVDTATLFQAASISKPVAAIAALRLVEQGRLALDEDVNVRLTSWKVPPGDSALGGSVTLRRLLSHNAGLTVHGFPGYARGVPVPTAVQVLDGAPPANTAPVRVDLVPGTRWRYSGGGYTVVQQLLSDVAARPFAALMEEMVLRPSGMRGSTYEQPLPDAYAGRAAHAHTRQGTPVAGDWHTYPEQAAAGLWTTPSDLARMMLAVQRAAAGSPGEILTPAMARDMLSVQAGEYGLGFGLRHTGATRTFAHGGSNRGFRAMFAGFVEAGQGAVVMTNADLGSALIEEILRAVATTYGWSDFRPQEKAIVAIDSASLPALAGRYRVDSPDGAQVVSIALASGRLQASLPNWLGPRTLYASGGDRFFMLESGLEVGFERDAAGRATAIVLLGGGQPMRATRIE